MKTFERLNSPDKVELITVEDAFNIRNFLTKFQVKVCEIKDHAVKAILRSFNEPRDLIYFKQAWHHLDYLRHQDAQGKTVTMMEKFIVAHCCSSATEPQFMG